MDTREVIHRITYTLLNTPNLGNGSNAGAVIKVNGTFYQIESIYYDRGTIVFDNIAPPKEAA